MKARNLKNKRFGKLIALEPTEKRDTKGGILWKCRCDCGNSKLVPASELTRSDNRRVRSCGCLKEETLRKAYDSKRVDGVAVQLFKGPEPRVDSTTGYRGVSKYLTRVSKEERYRAWITVNGKRFYKSGFLTPDAAYAARLELEREHIPLTKDSSLAKAPMSADIGEKMNDKKYSDEFLINEYKKLAEKTGKAPTANQFKYYGSASNHFGSWNNFKKAAGFEVTAAKGAKKKEFSKEELIKIIQAATKETGSPPPYKKFRYGSQAANLFGSWNAFLSAANLPTQQVRRRGYSKEFLINEYVKLRTTLGRRPASTEFKYYETVRRKWGAWQTFLEEAGEELGSSKNEKVYQGLSERFSDDSLIRELRKQALIEGNTPRSDSFKWYGVAIYHFQTWKKFVAAAGLPPRKIDRTGKKWYSDEFLLKEYLKSKKQLGHTPVVHEFEYSTVAQRRFGGWAKFKELAENYGKNNIDA